MSLRTPHLVRPWDSRLTGGVFAARRVLYGKRASNATTASGSGGNSRSQPVSDSISGLVILRFCFGFWFGDSVLVSGLVIRFGV
jgi:hypothetical protein